VVGVVGLTGVNAGLLLFWEWAKRWAWGVCVVGSDQGLGWHWIKRVVWVILVFRVRLFYYQRNHKDQFCNLEKGKG
jgi:hypothetical protein